MDSFFVPQTTIMLAACAIAWFLLGIVIGRQLPRNARPRQREGGVARNGGASRKGRPGEIVEIYVGNLSYDVTEKDLAGVFEGYGRVAGVRLIENRFTGKSKGFGFVEMNERGQAEAAIKALNGTDLKGRKVVVNEARSRPRD